MYLNYKRILRTIAIFFVIIGVAMLPSIFVSLCFGETAVALSFCGAMIPSILIGIIMLKCAVPSSSSPFKIREGFLVISMCWLLASVIGALPYVFSASVPNFIDALFESVSGFSSTGATIIKDVEILPHGILFWRCFTSWLGGLGILAMAVFLLPSLSFDGQSTAKTQGTGAAIRKTSSKIESIAPKLFALYIGFTLLETVLLVTGGLSLFDAVTHSFSTLSTGGFSNYTDSIAHFNNPYAEAVIIVFMLFAGISFGLYYMAFARGSREFIKDSEFRAYIIIILSVSAMIGACLLFSQHGGTAETDIRHALFQTVSIITTTGFSAEDYLIWPQFAQTLLLSLVFVGACSASAGGGIKIIRVLVMLKLIKRSILMRLHPNAIINVKLRGENIQGDRVQSIASFTFLYIFILFAATAVVSLDGFNLNVSFSAAASALGNVGAGFGAVGPFANYSFFSGGIKLFLSFVMLAGRLELFTLILLLSPRFWNPNH